MKENTDLRRHLATKFLVVWLCMVFCLGLYVRFTVKRDKDETAAATIKISERLAVVAKYSELEPEWQEKLLQTAVEAEKDEQLQQLLKGEIPEDLEEEKLSPTYALILQELKEPGGSAQPELLRLAKEGRYRFLATLLLLSCLLLTALASLAAPKVEESSLGQLTSLTPWGILGLFFAWDVLGFFVLGPLAGSVLKLLDPFLLIFLTQLAVYGLLMFLLSRGKIGDPMAPFKSFSWSWVGKGYLVALIIVFALNTLIGLATGETPQSENPVMALFVNAPLWKVGLLGLLVVFIGPLFEEILFRAWLFGGLRKTWGDIPAALVSSALFALIHGDGPALPALFVLGLIFTWVYRRSGSLYASILVHGFWNATTFALLLSLMP